MEPQELPYPIGINYKGVDWVNFCNYLTRELVMTYEALASYHTEEKETERLRGRATLIKQLLEFEELADTFRGPR